MAKNKKANPQLQAWTDARRRHRLSHAHAQMAYELGMNPTKFGKIDNHRQERWKAPLPQFIESLYFKRFGKDRPDVVVPIEEIMRAAEERKARKREAKRLRRETRTAEQAKAGAAGPPMPHAAEPAAPETNAP